MTDQDWLSMGMKPNGSRLLRVRVLDAIAVLLNVQFKMGGRPYGAAYKSAINTRDERNEGALCGSSVGIQGAQS